jgi:phage/plasmid-associated DNA primase
MVTKYPLPTERSILIIIGDPGSGKGTHLAAMQELLTFGSLTLFAKADPHKLTDPKEHFSRQNLQNKLALTSGDLKHDRLHDFSGVNDLFGGESQEMEKKFKDPTTEKPTFKAFWASTPASVQD